MPKKRCFSADLIIALSAMIIGLCTMIVYIYQARIMSKQLSTSVRPYVMVVIVENQEEISIGIQNKGVGPAFIKTSRLVLNGQSFTEENQGVFLDSLVTFTPSYSYQNLQERVLSPGDEAKLFTFANPKEFAAISKALQSNEVSIELCYCSVHEQCWKVDNSGTKPCDSCSQKQ
jgi:hypothetical protein